MNAVKLFQIISPTDFVRFLQNLAHMTHEPICKKLEQSFEILI